MAGKTTLSAISKDVYEELTVIKGELTAEHKKNYTYDDTLRELIKIYRKYKDMVKMHKVKAKE